MLNDWPADEFDDIARRLDGYTTGWEREPPFDNDERDGREEGRSIATFSAADLHDRPVPRREWLVDELIPAKTVTLLSGDGGTGKSLVALQLAVAIATGRPWIGHQVEPGRVLYASAEDDTDELHRRLVDIARGLDIGLDDLGNLTLVALAGEDAVMAAPEGRTGVMRATPLFAALEKQIDDRRPALVVLDTLADLFAGNENDRAQARQFVGMLRGLALRYGTTMLLLSHPSLSGLSNGTGTSGSTGWNNSVRSRLYLNRMINKAEGSGGGVEPDPDLRTLTVKKSNYAAAGGEIKLRWREGLFVNDAAFSESAFEKASRTMQAEIVFLDMLKAYTREGRKVSSKPSSKNYAPTEFAKDQRSQGFGKAALQDAMNGLFAAGKLVEAPYGPPSSRHSEIILAGGENGN